MSDDETLSAVSDGDDPELPEPAGVETVEAYEVDDGVVLYDAENPLAWVQTSRAVRLDDHA